MIAEQPRLLYALGLPHLAREGGADDTRAGLHRKQDLEALVREGHHEFFPVVATANVPCIAVRCGHTRCIAAEGEGLESLAVETDFHLMGRVESTHEIHVVGLQFDCDFILTVNREHVLNGRTTPGTERQRIAESVVLDQVQGYVVGFDGGPAWRGADRQFCHLVRGRDIAFHQHRR